MFWAIWSILRPFGLFYGHLVYFVAIWYILLPFGIFYGNLVYIPRFGMLHIEKSGNPGLTHGLAKLLGLAVFIGKQKYLKPPLIVNETLRGLGFRET
jgi:hypothetical protein